MAKKQRIDQSLVSMGLADDLDVANRLVMAGKVQYLGQLVFQSSQQISDPEGITCCAAAGLGVPLDDRYNTDGRHRFYHVAG